MPNTVRYSTRSLSYINKIKFLDTSPIASVSHDWLAGAELAGFYRGFRFQGEYIMNNTVRMEGLADSSGIVNHVALFHSRRLGVVGAT